MLSSFSMLKISILGESHGDAVGATIEGLPSGIAINQQYINEMMARRQGGNLFGTPRKEEDVPQFLSGIKDGFTSGTPICFIIKNNNKLPEDYKDMISVPRPSHADYTQYLKYGDNACISGGGHFSGRLTAPMCVIGAIAKSIIQQYGVKPFAYISEIGGTVSYSYKNSSYSYEKCQKIEHGFIADNSEKNKEIIDKLAFCKSEGDSLGGVVECQIFGSPKGLGGAIFDGMESRLSSLLFGIPGVKGVEFGLGFDISKLKGSEANDMFDVQNNNVKFLSNNAGGINGGITNGEPIGLRVAFRPTPSIVKTQQSINLKTMQKVELNIGGRHDCCIALRAVPVVESIVSIGVLDAMMESKVIG